MNTKEQVDSFISNFKYPLIEPTEEGKKELREIMGTLGIRNDSEFFELYTRYYILIMGGDRRYGTPELLDTYNPFDLVQSSQMAHECWKIPKKYVLFSTGSAESGYLYDTEDNTVWDFSLGDQKYLGTDKLRHWNSFYEFMVWYLTIDKEGKEK